MTNNLGRPLLTSDQADKEGTINADFDRFDAAFTEKFTITAINTTITYTPSSAQAQANIFFDIIAGSPAPTGPTVLVLSVVNFPKRIFVVRNNTAVAMTVGAQSVAAGTVKLLYYDGTTVLLLAGAAGVNTEHIIVSCSDLITDIIVGTTKGVFIVPYNFTVTEVFIGLGVALSGAGAVTVDVNKNTVSILTTLPSIVAGQVTNLTGGGTLAVIATAALLKGDIISCDIDLAGTFARGLQAIIIGTKT